MPVIALIGASENSESLAFKLFIRLKTGGFELIPINPKYKTIADVPCFASLSELPTVPEVVIFMINPQLSLKILEQVVTLKIKKVWFQPGTFDDEVLAFCKGNKLDYENEKCLIISPIQVLEEFVKN